MTNKDIYRTGERMSKKPKRFAGITLQIGVPLLIFLVILTIFEQIFLIAYYANNFYSVRKNSSLDIVSHTKNVLEGYESIGWLARFWGEHYGEMELLYDPEKLHKKEREFRNKFADSELTDKITEEEISAEPYETQLLYAEICYGRLSADMDRMKTFFKPVYLYSFAIDGNERIFLITGVTGDEKRISQGGELLELGQKKPYIKDEFKQLDYILEKEQSEAQFETVLDRAPRVNGLYALAPVYSSDGKLAMIAAAYYDWRWYLFNGSRMLYVLAVILIIGAILISIRVMRLLEKNVIVPISREQEVLKTFKDNKSAPEAIEALEQIQPNNEIEDLADNFAMMIAEIDQYVHDIRNMADERQRIASELSLARTIQTEALPMNFPPFPERKEFELYASVNPAKETGGDFYDFFFVDESHLVMLIADVSGKGIPAALFMMRALTYIRTRAKMQFESPVDIISDVNKWLCERNEQAMFVTVWLAVFDVETGKGVEINAGHEDPVIKRAGGDFELVQYEHTPALALFDEMEFSTHEFEMKPGDSLLVYTDGVPECNNTAEEMYTTDRLLKVLNRNKDASMEELVPAVIADLKEFSKGAPQFDDITLLGFRYFGSGSGDKL